ncbi:MAG: DoxX family membrane protein [Deltaproteobacteria bacterium]|nr:DoxX family membrane protein [Deltaproteobacteria bacterium]
MNKFFYWQGHAYFVFIARVYLALIFLFACYHKILHPDAFALDVATYQILPLELVNLMAIILPWVELTAGLMLLLGFRIRAASLLICAMMLVFILAVVLALHKGLHMACGCFASQGANEDPISWRTIVRDSFWLILGIYIIFFNKYIFSIDGIIFRLKQQRT